MPYKNAGAYRYQAYKPLAVCYLKLRPSLPCLRAKHGALDTNRSSDTQLDVESLKKVRLVYKLLTQFTTCNVQHMPGVGTVISNGHRLIGLRLIAGTRCMCISFSSYFISLHKITIVFTIDLYPRQDTFQHHIATFIIYCSNNKCNRSIVMYLPWLQSSLNCKIFGHHPLMCPEIYNRFGAIFRI